MRSPGAPQRAADTSVAQTGGTVALRTLGRLELVGYGRSRQKPLLLLAYLAIEGPTSSRYLSELVFAGAKDPRDALSTTLARLRRLGARVENVAGLVHTSERCDAVHIMRRLDDGRLAEACEAYEGPFLAGLDVSLTAEMEEWVFATREHLAGRVRAAHLSLAEQALATGDRSTAARHAERAHRLARAPHPDPEELRRLYAALRRSGCSEAAHIERLADAEGLDLGDPTTAHAAPTAPVGPVTSGPLVGREAEMRIAIEALRRSDMRHVTLHGPGGVGKTRLALELLRHPDLATPYRRHAFVALEAHREPTLIPYAIATALDLPVDAGAPDPWRALAGAIGAVPTLLVLDAWEHLVGASARLTELLGAAPSLTVIVTSRERLLTPLERALTLGGLETTGSADDTATSSPAPRLFVECVKRRELRFEPSRDDLPSIDRICRAVDGLPLGLVLAAELARTMPLSELADVAERDAGALADPAAGADDRHASLAAVVVQSWQRLGQRERHVASRLSVFQGGFRREAASAVAGATIKDLARLVDRSWLTMQPDGRFDQHAVLRQLAARELEMAPDDAMAAVTAHARYLVGLIGGLAGRAGAAAPELLRLLREEEADLVACFDRAAQRADVTTLSLLAEPLQWYFAMDGRFHEAAALFRRRLALVPDDESHAAAIAHVEASRGWCLRYAGDIGEARTAAERALTAARTAGDAVPVVRALDALAMVEVVSANHAAARRHIHEGLALARRLGDDVRVNRLLEKLVYAAMGLGAFDEAEAAAGEAQQQVASGLVPPTVDAVATHLARGYLCIARQRWDGAIDAMREGVRLAEAIAFHGPLPLLRGGLAIAEVGQGTLDGDAVLVDTGAATARLALPQAEVHGDGVAQTFARLALARAELFGHRAPAAIEHVRAGLRVAQATGNRLTTLWILPALVDAFVQLECDDEASRVAAAVVGDPAVPAWVREEVADRAAHWPTTPQRLDDLVGELLAGT